MKRRLLTIFTFFNCSTLLVFGSILPVFGATADDFVAVPPFVTSGAPPLVMLVMGRNHKLYYEAYNDASDLNGDDVIDFTYMPEDIDYYGYFDNFKCYEYDDSTGLFEPASITDDKKCSGTSEWSGDFLNYITMSRMDTIRKVLYGGYRSTDSEDETILERVYIPQDAHSWGKEYTSEEVNGYDITEYTPLDLPVTIGDTTYRHLFASTTLSVNGTPVVRVAQNSTLRIWEWVSVEGNAAKTSAISTSTSSSTATAPSDHEDFEDLIIAYAQDNETYLYGTGSWLNNYSERNHVYERYSNPSESDFGAIDGAGNPYGNGYDDSYESGNSEQNYFIAVFTGTINITEEGTYFFGVDGDDSVEVIIDGGTDKEVYTGRYGLNGSAGSAQNTVEVKLAAGEHTIEYRMLEQTGQDKYYLYWKKPGDDSYSIVPNSAFKTLFLSTYRTKFSVERTLDDYDVKVRVCDPDIGLEDNCKTYSYTESDGTTVTGYKPVGILQRYGETGKMYFGLMSGSWTNNISGGVLRKNISDISDEIDSDTGQVTDEDGIIGTINKFKIYNYTGSQYPCGWNTTGPMDEVSWQNCNDWGNPVAEMMYETVRYFSGKKEPTSEYTYSGTEHDLAKPDWEDPYETYESCSAPYMLILSDINPTFDTDDLPGVDSEFGSGISTDLTDFSVSDLMDEITEVDDDIAGNKYIGQSGTVSDDACSEKTVSGFGNIRGLCPEEPTKKGGYYAAGIAYYGHETDVGTADDDQNISTYAVGLASPLPRIELDVGEHHITAVPFAKSIGGEGYTYSYMPTNTIVDFYVETLTDTYGKFRINYEDVEQGADHDMDDIVVYEYQLIDDDGNDVSDSADATKVRFNLESTYAAGGIVQHAGYIISGTTADGMYLEVKDLDTTDAEDNLVWLDTPAVAGQLLGYKAERVFTPNSSTDSSAAELVENPLWYAAKWGGFNEKDSDGADGYGVPDSTDEWDSDGDGDPDTYFYVTNPTELESQLNKSFAAILANASSGTAASVVSNSNEGDGAIYQSLFFPSKTDSTDNTNTITWAGQLHALLIDTTGNMREDSNGNQELDVEGPDLNGDGEVYHEDINMNCVLDEVDSDGDGEIDYTEDMDGDGELDYESDTGACVIATDPADHPFMSELDAILVFEDTKAQLYYDVDGDESISDEEELWNVGSSDVDSDDISYLWNSSDWLNSLTLVTTTQRSPYISDSTSRYIFTWVDGDGDDLVDDDDDDDEILDFVYPTSDPDISELSDTTNFYAYLNLYPSFSNRPDVISSLIANDTTNGTSYFDEFLLAQTKREINWIRGLDDVDSNGTPEILSLSSGDTVEGTELRSRMYDEKTWRLGDIAYSTPTVVAEPAENYHLLYQDTSYATFYSRYEDRRNVIYAGANDGMVHAFNGGFYDDDNSRFCKELNDDYNPNDDDTTNDEACVSDSEMPELGAELWAYVPFNLLPHLYWLTDPDYEHSYYVDLKPRMFDAKIFEAENVCSIDPLDDECIHPEGWGTIMVVGMRLGGATIVADVDKSDGESETEDDVTMKSSYMIFDITNPEQVPTLLAEFSMPQMGFSFSYPTLAIMKDGDHDGTYETYNSSIPYMGENRWFLAFGSGPADVNGDPDSSVLSSAESSQNGMYYLIDLVKLGTEGTLYSLTEDSSGFTGVLTEGLYPYLELEETSFVDASVSVDYDLDFNTDALYFGTINGSSESFGGKMRRIVIDDINDGDNDNYPVNWVADSVMFDAGQPISAAATVAEDDSGRNWIYFGTGRYDVLSDGTDLSLQSYYGLKEPVDSSGNKTWATVDKTDLMDVTDVEVYTTGEVYYNSTLTTWENISTEQLLLDGWYIDFEESDDELVGERNLSQATLTGGLLTFTTFEPSEDVCEAGGTSYLWALYYSNGLPYYTGILGTESTTIDGTEYSRAVSKISLGSGMASTPNVHVGSQSGSSIFVQTSTGEILKIDEDNPETTKSAIQAWKLMD